MADAQLLRTTLEITAPDPDEPSVFTASGKAIQFAGFLRAYVEGSDDPAAEIGDQETVLPKLSVGDLVSADGPLGSRVARAGGARDGPAGALHRCVAREAARGGWDRPPVDVRLDHLHDRAPRLRLAPGQGARADLHGVRRDPPAEGALRCARRARVHRPDRGEPRRDLEGRARSRRLPGDLLLRRWREQVARSQAARREREPDRLSR